MILFLHNRYRTTGGEERVVDDLMWLVREHMGEDAELLERDSARLGRARAAAGLLRGGLDPSDVAGAVRLTGARAVHAHNLNPALGWRALAAAREAGARVVLHLHNYRLVCAVGTCFTRGADCTRCHGRNTAPGVALNCRGTGPEALLYGASLALWQRRLASQADAIVVPSHAALRRLRELDAPLAAPAEVIPHLVRGFVPAPAFDPSGPALVASRLAPEKGVDTAIDAAVLAGVPLVIAGDGPERAALERRAAESGGEVTFTGRVDDGELARLRASSSVTVVPSRSAETFGLAAAEAMAAGVPVAATRIGALPELLGASVPLAEPGDPEDLARAIAAQRGNERAAAAGLRRVRELCSPDAVAAALATTYRGEAARTGRFARGS